VRNIKHSLRLNTTGPGPSTRMTDTSGNPSESYHWGHLAMVRQEWRQQLRYPYVDTLQPTLPEIMCIERRVRAQLYP
jgi:hypothetical protein